MSSITLGLISDTHMGDRCRALPPTVFDALAGVDLILHAGDVGELWTLDGLADIAPVIAVHGNDELAGAPDVLPFQQVLFLAGRRILLTHGHHPDRTEEQASRTIDAWQPKLTRWAGLARAVDASIIIYGHTHIPWMVETDDVWVINPGAIASGSHLTRQTLQTVARLRLNGSAAPEITYFDLCDLSQPYQPQVNIHAGFIAAIVNEPIATPDLFAQSSWFVHDLLPLAPEPILAAVRGLAYRCLDGDIPIIDTPSLVAEILHAPDIPSKAKSLVQSRFA